MKQTRFNKCTAVFIALVLALQVTLPQAAFAEQRAVELDNHTARKRRAKRLPPIPPIALGKKTR